MHLSSCSRQQMRSAPVGNRIPDIAHVSDGGRLESAQLSRVAYISSYARFQEDSVGTSSKASSDALSHMTHGSSMNIASRTSNNDDLNNKVRPTRRLSSLSCISEKSESSTVSHLGTVSRQSSSLMSQGAISKKSRVSSRVVKLTLNMYVILSQDM